MQPNQTRQEILELADQMVRNGGYNAFSYADIASQLDIRRAAIHYYFPFKSDLGTSIIDREIQAMEANRQSWLNLPGDEQLRRLIGIFLASSRTGRLCLTGALTPEFTGFSPLMQDKLAEMCRRILEWMGDCLDEGREKRSLHFTGKSADRAILLMSTLASSLLLCRVLGPETFDRSIDCLLADLGAGFRVMDIRADLDRSGSSPKTAPLDPNKNI